MTQENPKPKQWVLITGGSRGIGRGLVETFARAGFDVVFTYLSSSAAAEEVEQLLASEGAVAQGRRCDCSNEAEVNQLASTFLADRGAPYAIINNAGITKDMALMRMDFAQWRDVIDNNLNSAFFVTRAFLGAMVEDGDGVILQMSSVTAIKGNAGQTNYGATKAALIGLTRSLALEVARFNVRVNVVLPGLIDTDMTSKIPEAQQNSLRKSIPLRRLGTVTEVAELCRYLCSPAAAYVTGQTFVIDGGLTT